MTMTMTMRLLRWLILKFHRAVLAIGPNLLFCVWSRMLSIPFVRRGNNTNRKQCKYIWGNSTNTIGETIQIGNNADLARHPLKRVLSGEGWSLSHEHIRLLFRATFFISAKTSIYSEVHSSKHIKGHLGPVLVGDVFF